MKVVFEDTDLQELIETGRNKKYRKYSRDEKFMKRLLLVYATLCAGDDLSHSPSFLHYERLKFTYSGYSSVRIGNQYVERIIFREEGDMITITILELNNTHYGNKK